MPRPNAVAAYLVSSLLAVSPLAATAVFDVTDGPFSDPEIVVVDLTPANAPINELTGAPPSSADFQYQFTVSGVTFLFESLSGASLYPDPASNPGLLSFGLAGPAVSVVISPAVAAAGFFGLQEDGCPGATFAGSGGNEQVFWPPPCPAPAFFGAHEIGDIAAIDLSRPASVWWATELRFLAPPSGPGALADLGVTKASACVGPRCTRIDIGLIAALNGVPFEFRVWVDNNGPDNTSNVLVSDFLPAGVFTGSPTPGVVFDGDTNVATLAEPLLPASLFLALTLEGETPTSPSEFSCGHQLLNVATVSSSATDPKLVEDPSDDPLVNRNLDTAVVVFDNAAVSGISEICDNGIDDNCDGRVDCADTTQCDCRPTLPPLPGGDPLCFGGFVAGLVELGLPPSTCLPDTNDAPEHGCSVPRGECGGVTVPAFCCDPGSWSNPGITLDLAQCDVGVPGCAPRDPNFKEAEPGVNLHGYGYAAPGQTIAYTIHYENVGNADAHDVEILDVLDPDLDDSTLVVADGGVYDPGSRLLRWTDPVVPPATPRSVSFEVAVRADAPPGTRVRNVGTIIFPDAVPPSRIDTNFVEHVIPDPALDLAPDLRVAGCTEVAPGEYSVDLVNDGAGFAYHVAATIKEAPPGVVVHQGRAGAFSHPDDLASLPTVLAFATTTSADTVSFTTRAAGDPCAEMVWTLEWQDIAGNRFSEDVSSNDPPEARCQDVVVPTEEGVCTARASVDAGSFDPDGDPIVLSQQPPGPYGEGATAVELTVEDDRGGSDRCQATVTVVDEASPIVECNAPATMTPPEAPISLTATSADNCGAADTVVTGYDCFQFTRKGKRIDKTSSCVVSFAGDTLTIWDSGGVGDIITWRVRAQDDAGNAISRRCRIDVVRPGGGAAESSPSGASPHPGPGRPDSMGRGEFRGGAGTR